MCHGGCCQQTSSRIVQRSVIIRVIAENSTEDYDCGLLIFPNPTDGKITVKIDDQLYVENAKIIILKSKNIPRKIIL